jgi:hypothetical protein
VDNRCDLVYIIRNTVEDNMNKQAILKKLAETPPVKDAYLKQDWGKIKELAGVFGGVNNFSEDAYKKALEKHLSGRGLSSLLDAGTYGSQIKSFQALKPQQQQKLLGNWGFKAPVGWQETLKNPGAAMKNVAIQKALGSKQLTGLKDQIYNKAWSTTKDWIGKNSGWLLPILTAGGGALMGGMFGGRKQPYRQPMQQYPRNWANRQYWR